MKVPRLQLYMDFERPLNQPELDLCRARLVRRGKGEPLQYIRGEIEFLDCLIKLTPAVLIPRQETEILVDKIIGRLKRQELSGKILWDVCCGSGCIGIALKKKFPTLQVVLSDLSSEALQVARENAQANGVDVSFMQGDLLNPFAGKKNALFCMQSAVCE